MFFLCDDGQIEIRNEIQREKIDSVETFWHLCTQIMQNSLETESLECISSPHLNINKIGFQQKDRPIITSPIYRLLKCHSQVFLIRISIYLCQCPDLNLITLKREKAPLRKNMNFITNNRALSIVSLFSHKVNLRISFPPQRNY